WGARSVRAPSWAPRLREGTAGAAGGWLFTPLPPPNFLLAPLIRRSGDIAPLNVNRDGLLMVPFWIREWVAGLISYQRTWAPAPPKTVCWVHNAVTDPCLGSTADTA